MDLTWTVDLRAISGAQKSLQRHHSLLRAATRKAVQNTAIDVLKSAQRLAPRNRRGRISKSGRVIHNKPPGEIASYVTFKPFPGGPVHGRTRGPSGRRIQYSTPNTGSRYLLSAYVGEVATWPSGLVKRIRVETRGIYR